MKCSQTLKVLMMLRENRLEGITAMDALRELGVARLAARISELRLMGHWIDSVLVKVQTRNGAAMVANYRLINDREEA
ncbi:helix-turn-helix domain-containing protein [Acidithiobacillus sp.]|uniref:helix-turn-helix domain-containing protein n=1 Tax=Acidithiobacillus sp. TaxID=1872118 RepID=UPI00258781CB|nr:helix-turn-helix domain-containing protein [Acidithiobacillus sp.]MDD5375750.1 helix-turn-helix domain-containing protein [Acidithiobacillus sp.]MDD5547172.1 helix-turn-helix domain-containing protein [Candidatus Omnitrophota bacterium]